MRADPGRDPGTESARQGGAGESRLKVADILAGWDLGAELVVLSACDSGPRTGGHDGGVARAKLVAQPGGPDPARHRTPAAGQEDPEQQGTRPADHVLDG